MPANKDEQKPASKATTGKRKKPTQHEEPAFEEVDWLNNLDLDDSGDEEDDSDYEEGDSSSEGDDERSEEESDAEEEEGEDGSEEGEDSGKDVDGESSEQDDTDDSIEEDAQINEEDIERTIMTKIKVAKQQGSTKSKPHAKKQDKLKKTDEVAAEINVKDSTGDNVEEGKEEGDGTEPEGKGTEPGKSDDGEGSKARMDSILRHFKTADEYEFDSSDEEDIRNTIGNVPMEWYEDYEHIGYDVKGVKIAKPPTRDELDTFLNKVDNPEYWRTIFDKKTGEEIILSPEDIATIHAIQTGNYTGSEDPYAPWEDIFTHEKMIHPVTRRPEDKRSFIPSLLEKKKVSQYVHALKMGWIKPMAEQYKKKDKSLKFYDIWGNTPDSQERYRRQRGRANIVAPKLKLPGHEESYNPPPEYLPTEEEVQEWNEAHPEDRKMEFVPKKYDCLRKVPAYKEFMLERFERCLDLYLCPRQRRLRVKVQPEDLLPTLPKPRDLQPFPTVQAIVYQGHKSYVRTISVDPSGQWLVSGSDDMTVKFWEVSTGRCLKTVTVEGAVQSVAWCPNQAVCLAAVAAGNLIHLVKPGLGDKLVVSSTDKLLEEEEKPADAEADDDEEAKASNPLVEWITPKEEESEEQGIGLTLKHFKQVKQVSWHGRGDYFSAVIIDGGHSSVMIHQLSKRRSQTPFRRSKGLVQCVAFHPIRPFLFVATQRYVRVYNLLKQELAKKLLTNAKWVSSISIHPGGDNVLVGSYDCKLSWFDMDLSTKPYKTLRHHKHAVRHTCYHKRYPLFASASDDGTTVICHGQVYNDLLQNPLIVPVKILRGHSITTSLGVLCCEFHPSQPWIFTSGADSTIRLYT